MLWSPPPSPVRLAPGEVHVWRAFLDLPAPVMGKLEQRLSPDELERAGRLRVPKVRTRFVAARAILREILARYLDWEAARLTFSYHPRGKPFLASPAGADALKFNVSHSHGLALYAVRRGREIGVDLELVRPGPDHERIAERFFSAREFATLRNLPPEQRCECFFQGWTRKEAYLKALGEGLAVPLSSFEVSLAPGEPAALLGMEADPSAVERWSIVAFSPAPSYVAAVVTEGAGLPLTAWDWQPEDPEES